MSENDFLAAAAISAATAVTAIKVTAMRLRHDAAQRAADRRQQQAKGDTS
jgi:hypothetical protein